MLKVNKKRDTPAKVIEMTPTSNTPSVEDMQKQIEEMQKQLAAKDEKIAEMEKKVKSKAKAKKERVAAYPQKFMLTTDKYVNIPRSILHDPKTSKGSVIAVYVAIVDARKNTKDPETGKSVPTNYTEISYSSLEFLSHSNRRTVINALKILEDRKYIKLYESGKTKYKSNVYWINPDPVEFELVEGSTLYGEIEKFFIKEESDHNYENLSKEENAVIHFRWLRHKNDQQQGDTGFVLNPIYHNDDGSLKENPTIPEPKPSAPQKITKQKETNSTDLRFTRTPQYFGNYIVGGNIFHFVGKNGKTYDLPRIIGDRKRTAIAEGVASFLVTGKISGVRGDKTPIYSILEVLGYNDSEIKE